MAVFAQPARPDSQHQQRTGQSLSPLNHEFKSSIRHPVNGIPRVVGHDGNCGRRRRSRPRTVLSTANPGKLETSGGQRVSAPAGPAGSAGPAISDVICKWQHGRTVVFLTRDAGDANHDHIFAGVSDLFRRSRTRWICLPRLVAIGAIVAVGCDRRVDEPHTRLQPESDVLTSAAEQEPSPPPPLDPVQLQQDALAALDSGDLDDAYSLVRDLMSVAPRIHKTSS